MSNVTKFEQLTASEPPAPEADQIILFPDLKRKYGVPWSRMHVDREEKAGRFPRRFRIGPNSVGWVDREVRQWVKDRIAERVHVLAP